MGPGCQALRGRGHCWAAGAAGGEGGQRALAPRGLDLAQPRGGGFFLFLFLFSIFYFYFIFISFSFEQQLAK